MANNNPSRNARTGAAASGGRSAFYSVLIAIAVIGAGVILYLMKNPAASEGSAQANAQYEALRANMANAGPPQPHVLGDSTAPVVIEEFADFECPSCGRFATITEPDVRKNLVDTHRVFYKYYDFPLPMHKNTQAASQAAACADEQGKFWPMHDQLFAGQDAWGLNPDGATQVTDNPKPIFMGYAKAIGLDVSQWEQCYDSKKYQSRIDANTAEGFRREVNETPTFYINGKKFAGSMPFDVVEREVAAAAAAKGSAPAPARQ
jgi:protein-disulfide isomerase